MIQGKLVKLRAMEVDDLTEVRAINDDPVVRGNVVGWGWPTSDAEMQRWHANSQGGLTHRWVIEDAEQRVIGVTGLWDVDWQSRHAMSAIKIGGLNEVRGRGLGTDAIKASMAFAFYDVGLNRLHAEIMATNAASMKVYLDKCGWTMEGTSRQHVWRHGRFVDLHRLGVLKEDFDRLPDAEDYIRLVTG